MSVRVVDGVVLIGGASRRMGVDKARLAVGGRAMADHVGHALRSGGCDRVIGYGGPIVDPRPPTTGRDAELPLVDLDLEVRPDRHPAEGPLGGVIGALTECDADVVVVVSCDLPFLDATTVRALVAAVVGGGDAPGDGPVDVAVATTDRRHHACAAWARSAEAGLVESFRDGNRALHRAIDSLRSFEVTVEPRVVENVNTVDDLRRLGLVDR